MTSTHRDSASHTLLVVFLATLGLLTLAGLRVFHGLSIDTDVTSVLPENRFSPAVGRAVGDLSTDVQSRIALVVTGDTSARSAVAAALRRDLQQIQGLRLLPAAEDLALQLLEGLQPFRFHLLSESAQERLQELDRDQLAEQALRRLYRAGEPALLDFSIDPFGVHQQTLLDTLPVTADTDTPFELINVLLDGAARRMGDQDLLLAELDAAIASALAGAQASGLQTAGLRVDRSGVFFYAVDAAQRAKRDVTLISTGSSIALVIVLLLVFRNVGATLLPAVSVLLGIGTGFVVTHGLFGSVHVFAIIFGVGLIGVVIDYSLHFLSHRSVHDSAMQALRKALVLSAATSIIGYGALYFSTLSVLRAVAVFAVSGIAMSLLTVMALGPYLPPSIPRRLSLVPTLRLGVSWTLRRLPRWVWQGVLGIWFFMVFAVLVSYVFTDNPRVFFEADADILASDQRASALTGDFEPSRFFVLRAEDSEALYDSYETLRRAVDATDGLRAEDLVSVLDWVPSIDEQRRNFQLQASLYGERGALDVLYASLALADQVESVRAAFAAAEGLYLRPGDLTDMLDSALPRTWWEDDQAAITLVLLKKGVDTSALDQKRFDNAQFSYVNLLARTSAALRKQRESSIRLLVVAFGLAAVLFVAAFRRASAALLLVVPALSSATSLCLLIATGHEINLFHIMACFLILGFGLDYMIFARQMASDVDTTLQAIFLSWLSSQLSFGLLGLSNIGIVSSFGAALFLGNTGNLLGAMVYMSLRDNPANQQAR